MVQILKWKRGPLDGCEGTVFVSATRFTYRRLWHMPLVLRHGLRLRREWPAVSGAVGLSSGADLLRGTTYTVSVWRSEADLQRWLRSPAHMALMRDFRGRMASSDAAGWTMGWTADRLSLSQAWQEASRVLKFDLSDRQNGGRLSVGTGRSSSIHTGT